MLTGIVYHGVDLDGYASAAIVADYITEQNNGDNFLFIPANYSWNIDIDEINKCDTICIVDFTFQDKDWDKLRVENVIWIDHHERNYKRAVAAQPDLAALPGIRRTGKAGIGLTWEYFYGDKPLTMPLQLLNDYDIWTHDGQHDWDSLILPFEKGMEAGDWDPNYFFYDAWLDNYETMFEGANEDLFIADTISLGRVINDYQEKQYDKFDRGRIQKATVFNMECLILNTTTIGSLVFGKRIQEAELCIAYRRNKDGMWRLGFYSAAAHINCAEIAGKFDGGGGHRGAAGATITHDQWKDLFNG